MVSACQLFFDDLFIAEQKASVPDDFIYMFQESDRREVPKEEDEWPEVGYFAPRDVVLQRLDLAGYTEERACKAFESWLADELGTYKRYIEEDNYEWALATYTALKTFSYDEWKRRAGDVLRTRYDFTRERDVYVDEIDRHMRNMDGEWMFFSDFLMSVRAMLDAMPEIKEVSLDIGSLIGGGWLQPDERICENRRSPELQWRSILQPTVILTEGSTDAVVLRRSLERLYPHLVDYITFFDHEGSKADGGVSYLVKFLRAFAAARINTYMLGIFDNDAAGIDAMNGLSKTRLPDNIKVTKLPDLDFARSYPTHGAQGQHDIDINGSGVSIELFLGRHNLKDPDGCLLPVVWGNYMPGVKRYQGEIRDKGRVFAKFLEETKEHDSSVDYHLEYPELAQLWRHVFKLIQNSEEAQWKWASEGD